MLTDASPRVGNVSQVESFEKRTFVPATVREYQMEALAVCGQRVALDARYVDGVSAREAHGGEVPGIGERLESREVAES